MPCDCWPLSRQAFPLFSLLVVLFWHPCPAPLSCLPVSIGGLSAPVTVGGKTKDVSPSYEILHGSLQYRHCSIVNYGYDAYIVLNCTEGRVTADSSHCFEKACNTSLAISVRVGEVTVSLHPSKDLASRESEQRLCRFVNPLYKHLFTVSCFQGELSVDVSPCRPQWVAMENPPWAERSRHTVVGLSDGAALLLAGLGQYGNSQEAWLWTPIAGTLTGNWTSLPKPAWTARYGFGAAVRMGEYGEEVLLFGGNDGRNLNDVWRWWRGPGVVPFDMEAGLVIGTEPGVCSNFDNGTALRCSVITTTTSTTTGTTTTSTTTTSSTTGTTTTSTTTTTTTTTTTSSYDGGDVIGRRWIVPKELYTATAMQVGIRQNQTFNGAVVVSLDFGGCRQSFRVSSGSQWTMEGCFPPGTTAAAAVTSALPLGQFPLVKAEIDRINAKVKLSINESSTSTKVLMESQLDPGRVGHIELQAIEIAIWPDTEADIQSLALVSAPYHWSKIPGPAPWAPRSSLGAQVLLDGDVLLMGGIGSEGRLNDVWRWQPHQCNLLPKTPEEVAAKYDLECKGTCRASTIGQWKRLPDAPWRARHSFATVVTSAGVQVLGGSTVDGFANDVWLWVSTGPRCSHSWKGKWTSLTAAASWSPRYGHSAVVFSPAGANGPETVLVIAGFGDYNTSAGSDNPYRGVRSGDDNPLPAIAYHDLWCGHRDGGMFSSWKELSGVSPWSTRAFQAVVTAPTMGDYSIMVLGGYDSNVRHRADFWRWIGESGTATCDVNN